MAENSKIEWTDHTFNPWIGCTKVSPACDNCYAERLMDHRLHRVECGKERSRTSRSNWMKPLAWDRDAHRNKRIDRVFCASLADVFDNVVPDQWRADLWDLIEQTRYLNWLLLTKRIVNAEDYLPYQHAGGRPNIWLGATVVNQKEADREIPRLMRTPAAVRFLSCEPLLGPINLRLHDYPVDWVIVGGESGPNARPMEIAWCVSIAEQCYATNTPFFMKQGSQANWHDWKDFDAWPRVIRSRDWPGMSAEGP